MAAGPSCGWTSSLPPHHWIMQKLWKNSSSVFHLQSWTWNISLIQCSRAQDPRAIKCSISKAEEMLPRGPEKGLWMLTVTENSDVPHCLISSALQNSWVSVLAYSYKANLPVHRSTSADLDILPSIETAGSRVSWSAAPWGPLSWSKPFCFLVYICKTHMMYQNCTRHHSWHL